MGKRKRRKGRAKPGTGVVSAGSSSEGEGQRWRERLGRRRVGQYWGEIPLPLPPKTRWAFRNTVSRLLDDTCDQFGFSEELTNPAPTTSVCPVFWYLHPYHRLKLLADLVTSGLVVEGEAAPPADLAHRQCFEAVWEYLVVNLLVCEIEMQPASDDEAGGSSQGAAASDGRATTTPTADETTPTTSSLVVVDDDPSHLSDKVAETIAQGAILTKEENKRRKAQARKEGMLSEADLRSAVKAADQARGAPSLGGGVLEVVEAALAMEDEVANEDLPEPDLNSNLENIKFEFHVRAIVSAVLEEQSILRQGFLPYTCCDEDLWFKLYECMLLRPAIRSSVPDSEKIYSREMGIGVHLEWEAPAVRELVQRKVVELSREFARTWSLPQTFHAAQALQIMCTDRSVVTEWRDPLFWKSTRVSHVMSWSVDFTMEMTRGLDRNQDEEEIDGRYKNLAVRVAAWRRLPEVDVGSFDKRFRMGEFYFTEMTPPKFADHIFKKLTMPSCNGYLCNNPGKLVCSGCNTVRYCSKACQKASWKDHKANCKLILQLSKK